MITFPNAKINLGLDIVARRPDGYHDIVTVMVPVPWRDVLEVVAAPEGHDSEALLTVSGRGVDCPPEKNLVMRAWRLMAESAGIPGASLYLRKEIPDGAGLGGGSADAAFTLRALSEYFGLGLTDDTLAAMASRLGADCPFFIFNRPMLCTGTGTDMAPIELDLSGLSVAVVKPPVSVPTAQAYSRVTPALPAVPLEEIIALPAEQWREAGLKNDFEPSVFSLHPELAEIKERLYGLGAVYASMSGSGSALYGIFRGDILTAPVADAFPGCLVMTGPLRC